MEKVCEGELIPQNICVYAKQPSWKIEAARITLHHQGRLDSGWQTVVGLGAYIWSCQECEDSLVLQLTSGAHMPIGAAGGKDACPLVPGHADASLGTSGRGSYCSPTGRQLEVEQCTLGPDMIDTSAQCTLCPSLAEDSCCLQSREECIPWESLVRRSLLAEGTVIVSPTLSTMAQGLPNDESGVGKLTSCHGVWCKYGHVPQGAVAPRRQGCDLMQARSCCTEGRDREALDILQLLYEDDVV